MTKRMEQELKGEIRKIYTKPKVYSGKRVLDFQPFEDRLSNLSPARAAELTRLIAPATIADLQTLMDSSQLTAEELVLYFLERIKRLDFNRINSVAELNPEAVEIARLLDQERLAGNKRGPLHGIPLLIKDNIGTGDRMHTTAGALALAQNRSDRDAFLVQRLRQDGAVILGKASMSEWAYFMGKTMPSGFSVLAGQVKNPYGQFVVWGSSTGSAVAVAAGLSVAAIGTETAGSIVAPASQNSTFGLKPSLGLISRDRIIPLASAQDTAGPLTRNMTDLAILLNTLRGIDPEDPQTQAAAALADVDFTSCLKAQGLQGLRIGILRSKREETPGDHDILQRAVKFIQKAGAEVVDLSMPARLPKGVDHIGVLAYSFRQELAQYLQAVGSSPRSLEEIIQFNLEDPANRMPWGQENLLTAQNIELTPEEFAAKVIQNRKIMQAAILKKLASAKADLLLSLANYYSAFYAIAGFPALCVPAGYRPNGEPVGVTFTGPYLSEPLLIQAAFGFEQASHLRQDPPERNPS